MPADSQLPPEAYEEILRMRTQPLSTVRFKTNPQLLLAYLLFYPALSILALALVVFIFGFSIPLLGSLLKWIRYLWKQKTADEIHPWFMQLPLVALLTYTLGWITLGEKIPFQAIGSILTKDNLFFLACFVGMYIYLWVLVCLKELHTNKRREQSEKREQEKERIRTLMPKVRGWGLGLGVGLIWAGMWLAPNGFQFSLDISSLAGGIAGLLGKFLLVFILFFTEDLIALYLRI